VAQSVKLKHLTIVDFSSDHDLRVVRTWSLLKILSLPQPATPPNCYPTTLLLRSLFKKKKKKKRNIINVCPFKKITSWGHHLPPQKKIKKKFFHLL